MLKITVPGVELYDDINEEFITSDEVVLELEHSLVSLSKWESIWEKPFLGNAEKTDDEALSYVNCMSLHGDIPPDVLRRIDAAALDTIAKYIGAQMTATWFAENKQASKKTETITSELIYYWMFSLTIPIECENWHINRLFTLIQVFNHKNSPPKKMSRRELAERNRQLNAARQRQMGTSG